MSSTNDLVTKAEQFEKRILIAMSGVAVLLLLHSMGAGNASSEAAFQNTVATNTYAFYQAKTTRQNDLGLAANTLDAIVDTATPAMHSDVKNKAKEISAEYRAKAAGYDSELGTGESKKELLAVSATGTVGGFFTLNAFFMLVKVPGLG